MSPAPGPVAHVDMTSLAAGEKRKIEISEYLESVSRSKKTPLSTWRIRKVAIAAVGLVRFLKIPKSLLSGGLLSCHKKV